MPSDTFFGPPRIDFDGRRSDPFAHRFVHGHFDGTETRFAIMLPDAWQGRALQFLQGGLGGSEYQGRLFGGPGLAHDIGSYYVESNQGHVGNSLRGLKGDMTILGWRASARTAELARDLAADHYGEAPRHSYVLGGSGGGMRSIECVERRPDLWQGAVPFMINRNGLLTFNLSIMTWAAAILRERVAAIADAMAPGGSGDAFAVLETELEREALSLLWRAGFPRGVEAELEPDPLVVLGMNLSRSEDPAYFDEFWTTPGYAGADGDPLVDRLRLKGRAQVRRLLTGAEVLERSPGFLGGANEAVLGGGGDAPAAIELDTDLDLSRAVGAELRCGDRSLFCTAAVSDLVMAGMDAVGLDGIGEGSEVEIDNSDWLAFSFLHRHLVDESYPEMAPFLRDGRPLHPQRPKRPVHFAIPRGECASKIILLQHTLDREAWPSCADPYVQSVRARHGEDVAERFRIWWVESAGHVPPMDRAGKAWKINYSGFYAQALKDVIAWVEHGVVPPADTAYTFGAHRDLRLPESATERGGIQPVIRFEHGRIEAERGRDFAIEADVEMPPGAGELVEAQWDLDGDGRFPRREAITGTKAHVAVHHRLDTPGEYLIGLRVFGHREGEAGEKRYRLANLRRARVVVSGA